jgi:XTP/dITP diphosphohydrolase
MRRLLLATNNPGKVREFRRLLDGVPFEVVTPGEIGISVEVEEGGETYAENAGLKARAFADAGGCMALADDSGIEVDALNGQPGVRSARYGGPGLDDAGRVEKLLEATRDVPDEDRAARFRAVVAVVGPGGRERLFEGVVEGRLLRAPRGGGGFGYDPIFEVEPRRSAAELDPEEKDRVSHRGKAVRAAAEYLRGLG